MNKFAYIIVCLIVFTVGRLSAAEPIKSITEKGEETGKWLITISIGDNVNKELTLQLRNLVTPIFSNTIGGIYKHSIDIDDKNPENGNPTKEKVTELFNNLGMEIAEYKRKHEGAKTMVMFSLVGHGLTDKENNYSFAVAGGMLSGDELVNIVKTIGADETILLLNSCQSGSLVNNHFPKSEDLISKLGIEIQNIAASKDINLAVITPVSKFINSFTSLWEKLLEKSFLGEGIDKNGDHIVSYQEWKNAVVKNACLHDNFVPKEEFLQTKHVVKLPQAGIDPQFFDKYMSGNLPLVLTKEGVQKYNDGTLVIPEHSKIPAILTEETINVCNSRKEFFHFLYSSETDALLDRYENQIVTVQDKMKILVHMENDHYKYSKKLFSLLDFEIKTATDENLQGESIYLLGLKGPKYGENTEVDNTVDHVINMFEGASEFLKMNIANMLGNLQVNSSFELLIGATGDKSASIRFFAIEALGQLGNKKAIPVALELFKNDPVMQVRKKAVNVLGILGAKKVIPEILDRLIGENIDKSTGVRIEMMNTLVRLRYNKCVSVFIKLLETDQSESVRLLSVQYLGRLGNLKAVPSLINALKNDGSFQIRVAVIISLAKLNATKAIPEIIYALENDENEWVRAYSAMSLGKLNANDEKSIAALKNAAENDPSKLVRDTAYNVLEELI